MSKMIEPYPGTEILVDKDTLEPEEYFKILKHSTHCLSLEDLDKALHNAAREIIKRRQVGQNVLADKLEFYVSTMIKEKTVHSAGFRDYVYRDILSNNISKVKPLNAVKLIELERFQRIIPDAAAEQIKYAKSLDLFDDFLVLFTDLTDNDYTSQEEKEFVNRNRDPICFGYFKQSKSDEKYPKQVFTRETYNRLYLVADWADEYCDLTWDKLINVLPQEASGRISSVEIDKIIHDATKTPQPKEKSFFDKLKFW
jgi:hypothetical protein